MAFVPPKLVEVITEDAPPYNHGYSEEEVLRITQGIKEIESRDIVKEPATFAEFKNYVVPWFRINRTTDFILKEAKAKAAAKPKEPKAPKEPKVKKLSKKAIQDELTRLMFKQVAGQELTPEEQAFYNNPTGV